MKSFRRLFLCPLMVLIGISAHAQAATQDDLEMQLLQGIIYLNYTDDYPSIMRFQGFDSLSEKNSGKYIPVDTTTVKEHRPDTYFFELNTTFKRYLVPYFGDKQIEAFCDQNLKKGDRVLLVVKFFKGMAIFWLIPDTT